MIFKSVLDIKNYLEEKGFDVDYNSSYEQVAFDLRKRNGEESEIIIGEADFSEKKFQASDEYRNFEFDSSKELASALRYPDSYFEKTKKEKDNVIEIQEEITLEQNDQKITLEKGDRIRILEGSVQTKNPKESDIYDSLSDGVLVYLYSGSNRDAIAVSLIESNKSIKEDKFYGNNLKKVIEFIDSNYPEKNIYNATRYMWSVFSEEWKDKKSYYEIPNSISFVWDYTIKAYKEYILKNNINTIKDLDLFENLSFIDLDISSFSLNWKIFKKHDRVDDIEEDKIYIIEGTDSLYRTLFFIGECIFIGKGFMEKKIVMKGFGFNCNFRNPFISKGEFLFFDFFNHINRTYEISLNDYKEYSREIQDFIDLNSHKSYDEINKEKLYLS